jgi:membrane AbrB-like protein
MNVSMKSIETEAPVEKSDKQNFSQLQTPTTKWILLILTAVLAGIGAANASIPGGLMLGPMVASILFNFLWPTSGKIPRSLMKCAQAAIGIGIAGAFRFAVLPEIAAHWFDMILVVGVTLLVSVAAGVLLGRTTDLDQQTAALGSLPGGATGMMAISISLGADTRMVSLMQYIRLVMAVGTAALVARFALHPQAIAQAPAAASALLGAAPQPVGVYLWSIAIAFLGAWGAEKLRIPAAGLLGPTVLGVTATAFKIILHPALPPGFAPAAYMAMGIYVGLLFDRESLRQGGKIIPKVMINTIGLIAVCAATGKLLSIATHNDYLTGYLATTPGGLDTVIVVALGSGADVSFTLSVQMVRLLTIVILGPILARWVANRFGRPAVF